MNDLNDEPVDLEGCQFIHIRKEDGELIASIPLHDKNAAIIQKNGYVVVFGYKEEPEFEDKDGKIYLIDESDGE